MAIVKICTVADANKKAMQKALDTHNMPATLEAFTNTEGSTGWKVFIEFNHRIHFREIVVPFYTALVMLNEINNEMIKAAGNQKNG